MWNPEMPGSVNSTIDIEKYPTKMSSVPRFVRTLYRVGRGARVCKIDQTAAYKHQHVVKEDWKLQIVEWGGRFFLEMRLMFGTKSSPGIYDELHKAFLFSTIDLTPEFTREDVEQHLDDVLGVGPAEEDEGCSVDVFFRIYLEEARRVGFRIDESGNTDKVQPPGTVCTALGVKFDTVAWTWNLGVDKMARILHVLQRLERGKDLEFGELESIVGRLIDVRCLVRGGRYNLVHFLKVVNQDLGKSELVRTSRDLREQARWWRIALTVAHRRSAIVRPDLLVPSTAVEGFCDAAGGTMERMGHGVGGLIPPYRYFYLPWPEWLNLGRTNSEGVSFISKLSCLELLGALVLLVTCGDLAVGGHLRIHVDNQGAVDIFAKGHSATCGYTSAVAKAIYDVSVAVGVTVSVAKIRRCSDQGSYAADMLSKGNLDVVKRMMPDRRMPGKVPRSILEWLSDPHRRLDWADSILDDLENSGWEVIRPY